MLEHTESASLLAAAAAPAGIDSAIDPLVGRASWVFKGRGSLLRFQPLLAKLAQRAGLTGESDSLDYFLSTPDALKKTPYLVLIGCAGAETWNEATGAGLEAAVLLFEYQTRLRGTRVLSTEDSSGRRNVLAPAACRAEAAALAARKLMRDGAQVARIVFSETHHGAGDPPEPDLPEPAASRAAVASVLRREPQRREHGQWTLLESEMPLYLTLLETFDKTLARIGQRTRSNLRYYRRRAEQDFGSMFVPDASLTLEEFLRFNAECTYAVPATHARWRYETILRMPQCSLAGVRGRDGRWLSVVALRRNGPYVELDWQMNRAGMPAASLATVMRSYLIEREISRGSTRLYIEGGTPQPIRLSFATERVAELIVKRRTLYVSALARSASRIFPASNRLAQCLGDAELGWQPW